MPEIRQKKLSYKQQLKQSEKRNLGIIKYVLTLEAMCKQVLLMAANKYDDLDLVVTPQGEEFKTVLAAICTTVAPVCADVEDMKLPPLVIAKLVEEGGKVIQFENGKDSDGEPEESNKDDNS